MLELNHSLLTGTSATILFFISIIDCQEFDLACQQAINDNHRWVQEWADHRCLVPHIFSDVKDQIAGSWNEDAAFYDRHKQISESCKLKKTQKCLTHNKNCPLNILLDVDFDVSGLPCQDHSKANRNRQHFDGKHGSVYLAWAQKHKLAKTPLVILENVPESCLCSALLPLVCDINK